MINGMEQVTKFLHCEKCGCKIIHRGMKERMETNPVLVCANCGNERRQFPYQKMVTPDNRFYL